MDESRAYTKEEARKIFLRLVHGYVEYWYAEYRRSNIMTIKEAMDGLAFGILNIIDGSTINLPSLDLVLQPHESDKEYCRKNGENWFESGMVINDDCHLHELYYIQEIAE